MALSLFLVDQLSLQILCFNSYKNLINIQFFISLKARFQKIPTQIHQALCISRPKGQESSFQRFSSVKMSLQTDHILAVKSTTHITDDVPGGLGCHNWDGITSQVVAFLLCFFMGEFVQTLNLSQKKIGQMLTFTPKY